MSSDAFRANADSAVGTVDGNVALPTFMREAGVDLPSQTKLKPGSTIVFQPYLPTAAYMTSVLP